MAGVAALAPYPEARHGRPLASERVRSLLDVEVAPKTRATGGGCLDSRPDSTDESSQQVVGSTENPWRAPQVGNRSGAIDCREVSAANAQTTLANVANVPHESYGADGFDGLLHGTDGHLSRAIRFPRVVARSATHTALEHNGTPDGGVDRTTASRSFPWDEAPRYLIRDRDAIFGREIGATIKGMRTEALVTAARSPWQNPFAERLIGSIRHECLDHVIVRNESS